VVETEEQWWLKLFKDGKRFPSRDRESYYIRGRDILRQVESDIDFCWPLPQPFESSLTLKSKR